MFLRPPCEQCDIFFPEEPDVYNKITDNQEKKNI